MSGLRYESYQTHSIARKVLYTDTSAKQYVIGRVPPCVITGIKQIKKTDFNSGTTATLDVGTNYPSSTTDDPNGLVAAADLTSGTALGLLVLTNVDLAIAYVEEEADIVLTQTRTGTAATTGEAIIVVEFVPIDNIPTANTL